MLSAAHCLSGDLHQSFALTSSYIAFHHAKRTISDTAAHTWAEQQGQRHRRCLAP